MKNKKVEKVIKDSCKVLAFVLVFFVLLQVLSTYVFAGQKVATISNRLADAYSFTEDDPYTTDIVCLGSSDMYSGFVPITLWDEYGYTSTVACCSHESFEEAQTLLESIRENQNPKLVLMEIDTLYDGRNTSNVIEKGNEELDDLFEDLDPSSFESNIEKDFSIFSFHNAWKLDLSKSKRHKYSHGYLFNNTVYEMKESNYMAVNDKYDMPTTTNITALKDFTKYCEENDMNLVFVEMPSRSSWNYARHNAVQELADDLGIELIDMNLLYDEIGISQTNCFRDKGNHLTYAAASKATEYLGNYIKENYSDIIIDHRSDSTYADRWNEDSKNFKELNKIS